MGPGWGGVLAISPSFAKDRTLFVGGPLGVLRSRDAGMSFESVFERAATPVCGLGVSPGFSRDGTVFAAVDGAVYKSVDGGSAWKAWLERPEMASPRLAISPGYADDKTLFLGSTLGLWRSRYDGTQWQMLDVAGLPETPIDGLELSPYFVMDQELLVHVRGRGLFRSRDSGETFAPIAIDNINPSPAASHMNGFPDRTSLIKFSPRYNEDHMLFISSMEDLLRSTDSGRSWTVLRRPVRYESVRPEIFYRGKWRILRGDRFSSGAASCSSRAGDAAVMEFVGQEASWIGRQGPDQGMAKVLIDGELAAVVDQYAEAPSFSIPSYVAAGLRFGPHTMVVEVIADKNPRSAGTNVIIDAFDIQ